MALIDSILVDASNVNKGQLRAYLAAQELANVRHAAFGAVGDGVTDDTAAIQAAIDSLTSGGIVYLPPPYNYKTTASLKFKVTGTVLMGGGHGSKIICATAGQHGIESGAASTLFKCGVHGLTVKNAAGVTCGNGIYFKGISDSFIWDAMVDANAHASDGFVGGIVLESTATVQALSNRLYHATAVTKDGASSIALKIFGTTSSPANSNAAIGGKFGAAGGKCAYILGNQNAVAFSNLEADAVTCVQIDPDNNESQGNAIVFNRLEGAMTTGILFSPGTSASLAMGNMYSSGVTTRFTDNGDNTIFEPYAANRSFALDPLRVRGVATASLPVESAGNDGLIVLEDTTGGANLVAYLDATKYRFVPRKVSANNGDADVTLTVAGDETTQFFGTALTAHRAVTLSTTGAYNGARFRIIRAASATGAFNLNVGAGPLKALATAGTWCEVEFDGSSWILTAYGAL